jgi:hypothetical protein
MKIELVELTADAALHEGHGELVVITTTDQPLGPKDWEDVWTALEAAQRILLGDLCGTTDRSGATWGVGGTCKFDVDTEYEMDPDTTGYVQWWAFPKK